MAYTEKRALPRGRRKDPWSLLSWSSFMVMGSFISETSQRVASLPSLTAALFFIEGHLELLSPLPPVPTTSQELLFYSLTNSLLLGSFFVVPPPTKYSSLYCPSARGLSVKQTFLLPEFSCCWIFCLTLIWRIFSGLQSLFSNSAYFPLLKNTLMIIRHILIVIRFGRKLIDPWIYIVWYLGGGRTSIRGKERANGRMNI